jgi:hypothetical protein
MGYIAQSMQKQAITLNIRQTEGLRRNPEIGKYLSDILKATRTRGKGHDLKRLLSLTPGAALGVAAGSGATIPTAAVATALGLALGIKFGLPAIQDAILRKKLKKELGADKGEEVGNLSQRVYNKSTGTLTRGGAMLGAGVLPSFLGNVGRASRQEDAAVLLLDRVERMLADPAQHVGPYSVRH